MSEREKNPEYAIRKRPKERERERERKKQQHYVSEPCLNAVCAVGKETGADNNLKHWYGGKLQRRGCLCDTSIPDNIFVVFACFSIGYIKVKLPPHDTTGEQRE